MLDVDVWADRDLERLPATVDDLALDKEQWILEHGSDTLRQGYLAGYPCDLGYLQERIDTEYPGFVCCKLDYVKVDTPSDRELHACFVHPGSYAAKLAGASSNVPSYLVVDRFLGVHQLVLPINLVATDPSDVSELFELPAKPKSSCSICDWISFDKKTLGMVNYSLFTLFIALILPIVKFARTQGNVRS
ncbi:MAG: hypothetical protein HC778_00150 [Chamaesiphon sp. CSU_1_12]|nr:hypothetical protein [Chamaesiphon sp. CSU_1_12]